MIRTLAIALAVSVLLGVSTGAATNLGVSSRTLDVYRTCVLTGASSTSTAVAETYVNEGSATSNFGTATTMGVQTRNGNRNQRSYLRFDLTLCSPALTSTATLVDARLDVFVTTIAAACRTIDAFRVTAPWGEGTITWNSQPFGTTSNNPPTAQRSAFTTIGSSPCTYTAANQYVSLTVTTDVTAFIAGTSTNYGWMLRDDVENSATQRVTVLATTEANNAARGPRLIITYKP